MYFKGHEIRKGYTEFEKKETLNQMPGSSLATAEDPDGNKFFNQIQQQFQTSDITDSGLPFVDADEE